MFEVSVTGHFDAAHSLRGYGGKCENVHGHRFEVIVTIAVPELNHIGLAYDFVDLKSRLKTVLDAFDHKHLNELQQFSVLNPSSENIAKAVYDGLKGELGEGVDLKAVDVWESPENHVRYCP
jgi:6-pyruvoyltetrahydropterin/6-carboxytetrahydropterin synthase